MSNAGPNAVPDSVSGPLSGPVPTPFSPESIPAPRRADHEAWLRALTSTPTAAGHEHRVIAWIASWLEDRAGIARRDDPHGNIELRLESVPPSDAPLYLTAHLDHPAFHVERVIGPGTIELSFRGGVMEDYFVGTRVRVHASADRGGRRGDPAIATITERGDQSTPFKSWVAELDSADPAKSGDAHIDADIHVGDFATWDLPDAEILPSDTFGREIEGGCLHTPACDDLAALASALAALDELRLAAANGASVLDTRVLLTRAEEIGFIGAIGASRDGFMPPASRIIALENSRSFPADSPIGGGPIVRVGDRINTFSPALTASVAKVAETLAGATPHVVAVEKAAEVKWKWQRKLMAGGACEASVFCSYGYEATCVCLPLGNYHNMAQLDEMQSGAMAGKPLIERECIAMRDFHGMTDLLVACGTGLPEHAGFRDRIEKLWGDLSFVLSRA